MTKPAAASSPPGANCEEILQEEYCRAKDAPSDINEHLPLLRSLAESVASVAEFGVRGGESTRAFLAANVRLRSYDIVLHDEVSRLFALAKECGRDAEYARADVLQTNIEETDMLFIDTLHTRAQLSRELRMHGNKARRYLAFHDTDTFGLKDEVVEAPRPRGLRGIFHRLKRGAKKRLDIPLVVFPSGGLLPSILEFLAANPQWRVKIHRTNNNGLTVLERAPCK